MLDTDIKKNLFSPLKLADLFPSKEIFSLIIYSYLEMLEYHSSDIPLTSTLIHKIVDKIIEFYSYKFELFYFFKWIEISNFVIDSKITLSLVFDDLVN